MSSRYVLIRSTDKTTGNAYSFCSQDSFEKGKYRLFHARIPTSSQNTACLVSFSQARSKSLNVFNKNVAANLYVPASETSTAFYLYEYSMFPQYVNLLRSNNLEISVLTTAGAIDTNVTDFELILEKVSDLFDDEILLTEMNDNKSVM